MDGKAVSHEVMRATNIYMIVYLMIMAASITACKLAAETLDDKKQAVYIQEMLDEMGESTWQN